ncbi:MAG: 2-hydroxychromene-2-carboxylate isomerase [Burkholderiales bacterium]
MNTPADKPAPIDFYFDFVSPFGYFASLRIDALAEKYGREVEWHSMLLGVSVLKVMGSKPLLSVPLKGDYLRRDVARYKRRHGLVLARKSDDPMMDSRWCGRAFHWVKAHLPGREKALARALYQAYWVEGRDLGTPQAAAAAVATAGFDAAMLEEEIRNDDAGRLLRSAVEESMKRGVFGSPTFVVDGELFWGMDTLSTVEDWLARGGW